MDPSTASIQVPIRPTVKPADHNEMGKEVLQYIDTQEQEDPWSARELLRWLELRLRAHFETTLGNHIPGLCEALFSWGARYSTQL